MNPERQRIKIAELQGWKRVTVFSWSNGNREPKQWLSVDDLPDYLNSRDALAPVLAGLTENEGWMFVRQLARVVTECTRPDELYFDECFNILIATPAQLAESYLRTKGEWEE